MNYLYLISINLGWVTIYKIGVAQNVKARMAHMIRQTGCECKLIASWGFEGKYGDCLKNYRIENQILEYRMPWERRYPISSVRIHPKQLEKCSYDLHDILQGDFPNPESLHHGGVEASNDL